MNEAHPSPALSRIRVGTVNYLQENLTSWQQFADKIGYWVSLAADYGCQFICLPEFLTLQLLSLEPTPLRGRAAIERLGAHSEELHQLLQKLAQAYRIHIVGGSHLRLDQEGRCFNTTSVYLADGRRLAQDKIHPTPSERGAWNVQGGDRLEAIVTPHGTIGVLICYDSEFPELARHLIDQGAQILFVPFCTDDRLGYLRVRYCSQARAIENQCYVVLSGNVGQLRGVHNMDGQYGQACILTPCDFGFARDGIAAEAQANVEALIVAELQLDELSRARKQGTVRNLGDRRSDLYTVQWNSERT
jgi:predicted amidohydrolase